MCGIVGYVGHRSCEDLLLRGLERLQYRGYDSSGLSLIAGGRIESIRAVGNPASLREALRARAQLDEGGVAVAQAEATAGIGHTRWATHGGVTVENAHPHCDTDERIHIVLNGIIENHVALRHRLSARGAEFSSETDAESVAHLIAHHYVGDLAEAVRTATRELEGHFAFVAISADEPDRLVAVRKECPLVVGFGEGEHFIASALPAFLAHTRRIHVPSDGEIVVLAPDGAEFLAADGSVKHVVPTQVDWDDDEAEKGGFETFMLKEIHEQPVAITQTLAGRLTNRGPVLDEIGISDEQLLAFERVVILGCGTSYHAGLAGRMALERWARIPVEVDLASEFRYRNPIVGAGSLVIGVTQSGETADTLAAMRLARERGATVLAVTNVMGSQATRDADGVLFTRAGIEIGVAATKTFVAQVVAMYLLAVKLAEVRGALSDERVAELSESLLALPETVESVVREVAEPMRKVAAHLAGGEFFLYLGRLSGLPVALEGALKLKEISYIPTDAYAAGEMKHGPIALLSAGTPVICVATDDTVLDKMLSNISEVRARGARVLAIATEGSKEIAEHAEHVVYVPVANQLLQVILSVVPLQLLAYHIARARGLNVDQPRNLAKTVTVE